MTVDNLQDAEGNTRLISPREAVAEGVTLYIPDKIRVGPATGCASRRVTGERGYVANSVWRHDSGFRWRCHAVGRTADPGDLPRPERAEQIYWSLAYAITPTVRRGVETFAIAGLKVRKAAGNRWPALSQPTLAPVAWAKQHMQVRTTDNRQAGGCHHNAVQKGTAHDVWAETDRGGHECRAVVQYGNAGTAGRGSRSKPVLRQAGLAGRQSCAVYVPGRKYPQPYVALLAFLIWLNPLTTDDRLRVSGKNPPAGPRMTDKRAVRARSVITW